MIKGSVILSLAAVASLAVAADGRKATSVAKSIYYPDKSHTEVVQDLALREQTETTYSPPPSSVKISKKVYLLNEQGLPVQGNIYDGRDQLKARAQFFFDSFDRLSEQRMFNLQGEVFQRIVFSYDAKGRQLPPKSYSYNVKAPEIKAAPLDFTKPQGQAPRYDRSQGETFDTSQGNVPMLPEGAMGTGAGGMAPIQIDANGKDMNSKDSGKSKEGFFKRLFKKSDKK